MGEDVDPMRFEDLPLCVRMSVKFEETVEESTYTCPECKKESVERRIYKYQKGYKGRWYVDYCNEKICKYWDCGWI